MWVSWAEVAVIGVQLGFFGYLLSISWSSHTPHWIEQFNFPISIICMDELEDNSDYHMIRQKALQHLHHHIVLFVAIILNGTSSLVLSLTEWEPYHTFILTGEGWVMELSVVLAWLGLKAISKAQLFAASAFQNWSLSHAHRLGLGSGHGLWEICQVTFMHKKKIKSPVLNDNDAIIFIYAYLTHFRTFIWI